MLLLTVPIVLQTLPFSFPPVIHYFYDLLRDPHTVTLPPYTVVFKPGTSTSRIFLLIGVTTVPWVHE